MSFVDDIKKFADKTNNNAEDVVRSVLFQINESVIMQTPVDEGRARGGWVATVNSPSFVQTNKDASGTRTLNKANKAAQNAPGKVYYLANSVPYITILEYGGYHKKSTEKVTGAGYSRKAPAGMTRLAVRKAKIYLNKAVKEVT